LDLKLRTAQMGLMGSSTGSSRDSDFLDLISFVDPVSQIAMLWSAGVLITKFLSHYEYFYRFGDAIDTDRS
jgi:hypothetical protein